MFGCNQTVGICWYLLVYLEYLQRITEATWLDFQTPRFYIKVFQLSAVLQMRGYNNMGKKSNLLDARRMMEACK